MDMEIKCCWAWKILASGWENNSLKERHAVVRFGPFESEVETWDWFYFEELSGVGVSIDRFRFSFCQFSQNWTKLIRKRNWNWTSTAIKTFYNWIYYKIWCRIVHFSKMTNPTRHIMKEKPVPTFKSIMLGKMDC